MDRHLLVAVCALALAIPLGNKGQASQLSIGPNGINSAGLLDAHGQELTGNGISIGQVELGRPADPDLDNPLLANEDVDPAGVFVRDEDAIEDDPHIDAHAEWVASVMLSDHATATGVATDALLLSSAYVTDGASSSAYQDVLITVQHVATRNADDVRAVNHSWGKSRGTSILDGNSLVTLGLDWSATQHDVLHVVAGNEAEGGIPLPTDNYNGVTIAHSDRVGGIGAYRQVDEGNRFDEDAFGIRSSIDLLAPGENIEMRGLGGAVAPDDMNDGTSFARRTSPER